MSIGRHEAPNKGITDIWLTPLHLIEALGKFDLDPCGENHHRTADTIFCEHGLEQEWFGRVWLNPPYSEVGEWLEKLIEHGNGVALVFARTETKWAYRAMLHASGVFFPKGRYYFLTKELKRKGNAGAPSMFLSFGHVPDWSKLGEGNSYSK